jgi:hypothetical protein
MVDANIYLAQNGCDHSPDHSRRSQTDNPRMRKPEEPLEESQERPQR